MSPRPVFHILAHRSVRQRQRQDQQASIHQSIPSRPPSRSFAQSQPMSSLLLPSFISLMMMLLLLLHRAGAGAAEYMVGDGPLGWDTGTNYATWAQNYAFTIGDVLVFQYVESQHNVCEVTESTYRSCDVGGGAGVLRAYTSGYDRVELTEAKTYWFICDFPGHCLGGMKVAVNVSAGAGAGGQSPNVPLPPSGDAASRTGGRRSWMTWAPLALVVINWAR